MKLIALVALISTLSTGAFAHSGVDTTTPENGAKIAEVPAEINFTFATNIRLTRVDMTYQDHPSARLDLGDQIRFDRVFTLPLQGVGEGIYRIEWRGLGLDGHAIQGEFTFTVN